MRYRKENLRKQIATASRPTCGHASRLDRADLSNRQNFLGLHNGIKIIFRVEALLGEKVKIRLLNAVFPAFVLRKQFTEEMQDQKSTSA